MKNRYKQAVDNKKRRPMSVQMRHRLREGLFLVLVACAVFLLISLATYHAGDPGWSSTGVGSRVVNWGGRVGAWLADVFLSLFGMVAYLFPFLIVLSSWLGLQEQNEDNQKKSREWIFKTGGWLLLIGSSCGLVSFYLQAKGRLPADAGGIFGDLLGSGLSLLFNQTGSTLLFITFLLCGITLVTGLSWLGVIDRVGERAYQGWQYLRARQQAAAAETGKTSLRAEPVIEKLKPSRREEPKLIDNVMPPPVAPKTVVPKVEAPSREKKKIDTNPGIKLAPGALPPYTLLNPPAPAAEKAFANISFEELSILVEHRLSDFGVEAKVVAVHPGPVITRFELELAPGIKVSKITGLAKDIARSLSTISVRVVEVIPGKSVIGLEIPNENRELVSLRDILESQRYSQSRSPVSLVLGKDISGNPVVVDLTKMPHLLVAGTTGSGKSVSLNAMLLSMLFKATPEQLRFILIDPKMLELSVYDGIPHLLTPVITDMKDAANALRWCVAEMDKRYRLMASLGVRNIANYNQKVNDAIKQGQPIPLPGTLVTDEESAKITLEPLPLIVVIVDELADMMMVVGKKVEDLIARIAQKARAAGIHLILATQRPSVDVITGLIKANIPTRVAFQVSSRIDSRTILDQQGAEQLLGHGDMLYLPPGAGVPIRVHGAYVADEEVHRVVAAWRSSGQPTYLQEVTDDAVGSGGGDQAGSGEQDPLYDEAVRIVTESRRASISLVQRRLRIGYNRAARMMEEMELAGVVSSMDNSGSREVLAAAPPGD
ncbi:DNA translocase FtsK [Aquicella lusitana]|uniref:DNA translocase FtsK n=2 Tax=Aquicella lusitana TaxID=254246 RepID=A0A370GYQ0_9COXI|nr:DNA translocase FtsK [Aquicella lusitana]RDI48752.1 DNA translocase FtsK [Aquicella lusitana]VVC73180.1 DNA translocase FtsK [Aquicella lusitana]